jgi:hypothetical protein
MSPPDALAVRGFLADADTGAGLGGLRVELWSANSPNLVAASESDQTGFFRCSLPRDRVADRGRFVDIELRVLEGERQIISDVRALPTHGRPETIELSVPRSLTPTNEAVVEDAPVEPHEIVGRIRGAIPEGSTVRAVVKSLRAGHIHEQVVAEGAVDATGWYRVRYDAASVSAEPGDTSLSVYMHAPGSVEPLAQSTPVLSAPQRTRIDVRAPRIASVPSEYVQLERQLAEDLERGIAALDDADESAIDEVSNWLDVDPEQLMLFQEARHLEQQTGVSAPVFYALGRSGTAPALDNLLDVPIHELRTTIEEAAADGVIDLESLGDVDTVVDRLAAQIVEHAMQPDQSGRAGLGEVLAAAGIPSPTIAEVLRNYQKRTEGAAEFWESFAERSEAAEALPNGDATDVRQAVRVAEVVGPDPALLRRVHDLKREGRWDTADDLAGLSFDDWCDLLENVEWDEREADAEDLDGEDAESEDVRRDRIEARAGAILDTLEETFPNRFIADRLANVEDISPAARGLIKRAKNHDFLSGSIRARIADDPALVDGFEETEVEAAIEEVEAVERVSRVTDRADEVVVLVGTGMGSAIEIGAMPERHFIDVYAEALGGRAQASRVHAQAQQTAAASKLVALRLMQALQRAPFVLGAPATDAIKDLPDAKTLFQAAGAFCDCEHCGSVYSPAAYFVDLLRYLNVSSPERLDQIEKRLKNKPTSPVATRKLSQHQPLDVLLNRRPDLADLTLTCENTLTPLPYIDLVNELLEARVTGESAAHDTGTTPADVLRAVPQHISREAYKKLQEAVYPLTLPYHQPLAVARAYLAHLGVTRLELLHTLGRADRARDAVVAEALATSPEEYAIIASGPAAVWRHFGFASAETGGTSFVQTLAHVPAFLDATGITFQQLIDLVSTRFLNGDDHLRLETPTPDCNPDLIRIAGLDEPRLTGMLRLIRLQRRLGWPLTVLDRVLLGLQAGDLDTPVLDKLTIAHQLATRLDRPVSELLVLWSPIATWGKDNEFDRLFATRAVAWRTQDERTFQLRPDRTELAETGPSLDPVSSALLAAFRITSEELAIIRALNTRRGAEPRLDLAGLSAIYRVVVLARALPLRIPALDLLLRLTRPEADPFRPGDPAATKRFVEIVREVQASDFTPERLAYLFRHESEPRRDPGPVPAQAQAVIANIRRGLADAFSETSRPVEVSGDVLRQKLAILLDPALLDPALEALDPRTPLTPQKRRAFFDRHLAKTFADPAAAAAELFGAPPTGPVSAAPAIAAPASTPAPARPAGEPPSEEGPSAATPAALAPATPASTPPPTAAASATATPSAPAAHPLDARWKANINLVLSHLLPQLRTRQLRGAVIQTLSDTLGLSVPSTARLLDVVLRSRQRANEPLLRDFLALLGTGLTGGYYANPDLSGEPVVTRTDPEITFAWIGAAPADGVPGRGFSARWTGRLLAKSKAPHTFYVETDSAVLLTLTINDKKRVLIDQPSAGRVVEHASEPIALDPSQLVAIRLEYRNQGGPATLALLFGTGPAAKQAIPTTNLYPVDGLSSFAPVEQSYRRLHKAALIITGFGMSDAHVEWLTGSPPYLDLDSLPTTAGVDADGVALMWRWLQLAALYALRKKLPRSNLDLFDVFGANSVAEAIDRLVLATGWERSSVEAFLGPDGFAIDSVAALRPAPEPGDEPVVLRLARAVEVQRRVGVAPATLHAWANGVPDADGAATIVQAVKARYDETRWLEAARGINDPLRAERRDALVAYLLPRMRDLGVRNRSQLFEYFLIDVDMNPCMLTSRIRQATGAVQTFFQRCLMNLEPKVPPRVIDDRDWKWLKTYRVWEAARKVFLYPENFIEPELRDDKSPLFQALESTILQQEIKNDNVEAAFADYLEGLDEISRLDVRGVWFEDRQTHRMVARSVPSGLRIPEAPRSEWDHGTYHIFARTFNAPFIWYYRRLESGRDWTPWEKIDADIEGEHLVPVVFNRRMHLFWTMFREVSKKLPPLSRKSTGSPPAVGKDWEIQVAYSVYDRGRWSRKRMSSRGIVDMLSLPVNVRVVDKVPVHDFEGSRLLSQADYTLRATVSERGDLPRLFLHLYRRTVESVTNDGPKLAAAGVTLVGRFALNGCNGALEPGRGSHSERVPAVRAMAKRRLLPAAMGNVRRSRGAVHPFRVSNGGIFNAPTGYHISGMGYAASPGRSGPLLALQAGDARGVGVALPAPRTQQGTVRILPVINPNHPDQRALVPFFFQDDFRSYFVRPIYTDWRPPRLVAMPLAAQRAFPRARPAAMAKGKPAPLRRRGGRGRREDIDDLPELIFEAQDAWEDQEDEAWHPDDAAEARSPRQRTSAPKPRPQGRPMPAARPTRTPARRAAAPVAPAAAVPQVVMRQQAGYHERQLHFTPFEHPDTCRFIATLKSKGIEGLLGFSTTRPPRGRDHMLRPDGMWVRVGLPWFQRHYGVGPLIYTGNLPHLDVTFESDSPYGAYNWELFFHAPLQVAVRLAKDGRHEEAQRWFHFIFDPTTDSSAPSPKRFWRFAPFYENNEYDSARELMQLLSYNGAEGQLIARQAQVRHQLSAWWERPFSPHVIARLRIAAYQKAVVMKYIDNLVEWGDKLFRRDSMESIQEATQIYVLAANILGPRPEKIPPIVSKKPLTFQQMRHALNLFSNFEVRVENLQVRRPFRINAHPDRGGATVVLGMATQYFCTPPNPQLDKYWETIADRLFKIRNCMNIQGIVRQLALFEPPIDPGLLVRAAAAGVDLGSVIARLNAPPPHYRFRFLLDRAVRLAEEIRSFGALTLRVLERKDAEALASLQASNETALLSAIRDIRKTHVRQVEEALAELSLEREHVEMQMQHLNTQLQQLMNPQEQAQQKSLSAAQVMSGIAEGVDLVAKVAYAVPEFQTGAAGGFSSPFVTLQLGGQMVGDIATAFATSIEKITSKHETEADLAAAQAEYQRRREEWQHELDLLAKEKAQIEKRTTATQLILQIRTAELRRHELEVENSRKVHAFFRDKYTNEQLYGWMLGQLSTVYFQAYKVAFDAAQQAEGAFRFERGDHSSSFIEFSYWDSLKKGLLAGERLLLDLRRLEAAHTEGDRRALEITRHISLREDFPLAFIELLAAGRCQIEVTEALLDSDFPGHYFRRLKTVSLTVSGAFKPLRNVNCTLTLMDNKIRVNGNASGSYAQSGGAEDSRFMINPVPVQAVATSRPDNDPGLFHLRFDDERYLPFEGAGAISTWRLELPQADNALDFASVTDVVMTLSYTARTGGAALEAVARAERDRALGRGELQPPAQHPFSVRRDAPALWKRLEDSPAGQEVELPLPLDADRFSGRYRGLDLRIERATVFAQARGSLAPDALQLRLDPPKGSGAPIAGWSPPWPRARTMRASAETSGPPGTWKLAVNTTGARVSELVDDLVLVFDLRARKR